MPPRQKKNQRTITKQNAAPKSSKPSKKKHALAWIFGCLGVLILGVSIILNLIFGSLLVFGDQSFNSSLTSEVYPPQFDEIIIEQGDFSSEKIAIIDIFGPIFYNNDGLLGISTVATPDEINAQLDQAMNNSMVGAVVLNINSGGGTVTASDEVYQKVLEVEKSGKPVIAYFGEMAASGAYYLSAPATQIVANPTTITGSLSVIIEILNVEGLFDKIGLKDIIYKSGEYKDMLSATREATDEEKAMIQGMVDEFDAQFVEVVNKGRDLNTSSDNEIFDGRIFTASQAKEKNLVDSIGYLSDAIAAAANQSNLSNYTVIKYEMPLSFSDILSDFGFSLSSEEEIFKQMNSLLVSNHPRALYLYK